MYQEEWQHFADYENMDQDRQNVPTPTLNVILVCPFFFHALKTNVSIALCKYPL